MDEIHLKFGVHYIVDDIDAVLPFYAERFGFQFDMHPAPGSARISRGDLQLFFNRTGAGGTGQAMPDGSFPTPGGWNRIQIEIEKLKAAGASFRNKIVIRNGGKQILIDDPSDHPIELFEPNR